MRDNFFIAMKANKWVNENSESELNIENLRSQKSFENITEQQAQIFISNIKRFANLLYSMYLQNVNSKNKQD